MRSFILVLALGTTQAINAPRTKTALQSAAAGLDDLDVVQVGAAALGAAGLNQWISPAAELRDLRRDEDRRECFSTAPRRRRVAAGARVPPHG